MSKSTKPQPVERYFLAMGLFLLATVAFFPARHGEFVGDDLGNFSANREFIGLSEKGIAWAFTTKTLAVYQPLSWLVLETERSLFGLSTNGYHWVSLFLHGLNGAALYLLILLLLSPTASSRLHSGRRLSLAAAFAVALFAVHPLRTEVVAWISCQPYLLCTFFLLAATFCHVKQTSPSAPSLAWYAASLLCFLMALLSKAAAVMFPVTLLLMDLYPFPRRRPLSRLVWEKLPFFALSLLFVRIALWARDGFGVGRSYGFAARTVSACYGIIFFLWKSFFPISLCGFYRMPRESELFGSPAYLIPVAVAIGLAATLFAFRRSARLILFVAVTYVAFLLPNLGFFSFSMSLTADRYSYVASLGWIILIAVGLSVRLPETWERTFQKIFPPLALTVLCLLIGLTWRQDAVWANNVAFWSDAFQHDGEASDLVNYHLGLALTRAGRNDEAEPYLGRSFQLDEDVEENVQRMNHLALALKEQGRQKEALRWLAQALSLKPADAIVHNTVGAMLFDLHFLGPAAAEFREALKRKPGYAEAMNNLALVTDRQRAIAEGTSRLAEELRAHPDDIYTLNRLGIGLAMLGKFDEALKRFRRALALKPDFEATRLNLARAEEMKAGPPFS